MPEPSNPQALNRYSYVLNNPLRYNDPSGHFSEEQLTQWFGKNWRSLFSHDWQAVLWLAEFGDAVVYGGTTVVFAEHDGNLVGWNVDTRRAQSILDIANGVKDAPINLYRPRGANPEGGPSPGNILVPGEMTSPLLVSSYHTNVLLWIYGDDANHTPLVLPPDWYRGAREHVKVRGYFAGWKVNWQDVGELTEKGLLTVLAVRGGEALGKALLKELGGVTGIILTLSDIFSWTTWDTSYQIAPGSGTPPPEPAPTPPPPQ